MKNPFRATEGVQPHTLSLSRLFAFVFLFLIAAGYAIWRSDRFQNMIQGVSQGGLTDALGVPVSFQTVELSFFPPSVRLANVRIGNDPKLGIPGNRPLFDAEEVSVGGGISLSGKQLRLGRIRAVRPHVRFVQLPDGRTNIPPGLTKKTAGGNGLKVRIGSILIQEGVLEAEGRKIGIDGRFDDFAAEAMQAALSVRFVFDSGRGLFSDEIKLDGKFGQVRAAGTLAGPAGTILTTSGEISIDEVERIFRADLGFKGRANLSAR